MNKEEKREYEKKYHKKNKDEISKKGKKYREEHKDEISKRKKEWYEKNREKIKKQYNEKREKISIQRKKSRKKNAEKIKKQKKKYYFENRDKIIEKDRKYRLTPKYRKRGRKRYRDDVEYRLSCILRSRTRMALKGNLKPETTLELLSCTFRDAKQHIEKQFIDNWSWENYNIIWNIDHIIPLNTFDLTKKIERKKAFHYKNLRPLLIYGNATRPKDGSDLTPEEIPENIFIDETNQLKLNTNMGVR